MEAANATARGVWNLKQGRFLIWFEVKMSNKFYWTQNIMEETSLKVLHFCKTERQTGELVVKHANRHPINLLKVYNPQGGLNTL